MSRIILSQKTLFEILQTLAQDSTIQRLTIDDKNDLSSTLTALSVDQMFEKGYIGYVPSIEEGIVNTTRNTFVIGQIENIDLNSDGLRVDGAIFVGTDREHLVLTKNRNRLLELADRIITLIDNKKFAAAGQISVERISAVTYSNYSFGYRISFNFTDQSTAAKAEI